MCIRDRDGAELGFGIILADTAAVELGVGVLDRTRQCGGILILSLIHI